MSSNTHETFAARGKGKSLRCCQLTKSEGVLMLSATVMRRLEALEDISKQGKRINGLFRLMEDQLLWHEAYANIYANKGAITPGVDEVTLDGFSEERVASIIKQLKDGERSRQASNCWVSVWLRRLIVLALGATPISV